MHLSLSLLCLSMTPSLSLPPPQPQPRRSRQSRFNIIRAVANRSIAVKNTRLLQHLHLKSEEWNNRMSIDGTLGFHIIIFLFYIWKIPEVYVFLNENILKRFACSVSLQVRVSLISYSSVILPYCFFIFMVSSQDMRVISIYHVSFISEITRLYFSPLN